MKKLLLFLFMFFAVVSVTAKKNQMSTLVGFHIGKVASMNPRNYSIPKYKLGLPVFSYATSIENRFTINYKLNFSLQYSLTYFHNVQQNLHRKMPSSEERLDLNKGTESQISTGISFNSNYKVGKKFGVVAGLGLAKPFRFDNLNLDSKKIKLQDYPSNCSNKFTPVLSPFLIIGIENNCNIFRKNLIYSIQYNLGFMPGRNLPMSVQSPQNESEYSHGIQIGLKYKY